MLLLMFVPCFFVLSVVVGIFVGDAYTCLLFSITTPRLVIVFVLVGSLIVMNMLVRDLTGGVPGK